MSETPLSTALHSCEIRWFWPGTCPRAVAAWFGRGDVAPSPAPDEPRADVYVRDSRQVELGIKRRGNKPGYEIKGLLAADCGLALPAPFTGPVQRWCKWTTEALRLADVPTITILKWRRLRKLDLDDPAQAHEVALGKAERLLVADTVLPANGCHLELTELSVYGCGGPERWWTLGLEAFGPPDRVEANLARAVAYWNQVAAPPLGGGLMASYPQWIAEKCD